MARQLARALPGGEAQAVVSPIDDATMSMTVKQDLSAFEAQSIEVQGIGYDEEAAIPPLEFESRIDEVKAVLPNRGVE